MMQASRFGPIGVGLIAAVLLLGGLAVWLARHPQRRGVPHSLAALPVIAAVGGMAGPAAVYVAFNYGDPVALGGWAIPAATDIAFALGILALLGSRVPVSLKVFLLALAIIDDLGAIIIIALFYTDGLSTSALAVAAVALVALTVLNRRHVSSMPPYIFVGLVLWVALLKSGVHATLAGVALAMFIPMRDRERPEHSPLRDLEHELHPVVAFVILPIFAFANSGIGLTGMSADFFLHPVSLGVAGGLFIGKQIGVFLFCWLTIRLGLAQLPRDVGWLGLYGAALLCGVGFTMSLFIGSLAFENVGARVFDERIGIVLGSLLSGIAGYVVLKTVCRGEGTCR